MSMLCHHNFSHLADSGLLAASPKWEPAQFLLHGQLAKSDHFSALGNHSVFQKSAISVAKNLYTLHTRTILTPKGKSSRRGSTGYYIFTQRLMGSP